MRIPSVTALSWQRGLITWLTYTMSGLVALTMTVPGTYVSQLYLAAGLGLGLVLGWGLGMLWAVALGGATVVAVGHAILHTPLPASTIAAQAAICGIGAALQVWVAYRLTLSVLGPSQSNPAEPELALDRPGQIIRFLLLVGPVASLTNALISAPSMAVLGVLSPNQVLPSALSWWAGDTMGVLVSTPIVLTLVARPYDLWRTRRLVVAVPLAIATVLLAAALHHVHDWDAERETTYFERDVSTVTNEIELKLNGYVHALEALHGVFQASEDVNRHEFGVAARYWLNTLEGIQGIGWEERVSRTRLSAFEAEQRAQGISNYWVFDRASDPQDRRPATGNEVVALRYIEPLHGNEGALGLNILSLPMTRQAYEQAMANGQAAVTRGFRLTQDAGNQLGVVVYRPVERVNDHTHPDQTSANRGALFVALRMDDTVTALVAHMPDYLSVCLLDGADDTSPDKATVLGGDTGCHKGTWAQPTRLRRIVPLSFAGSQWRLVIRASGPVPITGRGTASWLLAVSGSAFAAALGAMLLVTTGHTRKVEASMQEAREQRQAAETANRAKSEFLSRMSHELRTPLNAVLGFAQVMDIDTHAPLPPTQHQRLRQIQQAGWHLLDMIDDVLDISRIETGSLRLSTEAVPVRDAIEQACQQVRDQAANLGIELIWPQDIPTRWGVQADPGRLRQILHTLLDNGIRYNQRQGTVTVSVSRQQLARGTAKMMITIKDTGMGMTAEQMSQLFQPFNRLGREKQIPDGAGVGLAIGRHLATLMGGELEADSHEGMGAAFTLTLPAVELHASPVDEVPRDPGPPSLPPESPRHVLYVEDNLANSEVVRAALEDRPWIHLTVAPTIEQGLSVLHNRLQGPRPDLILLDVHLPDASGQEFLRLVKANPDTNDIPVVVISADAMPEQIEAALALGAACYLTKPVQLSALLAQVDELLQSPASVA